MVSCPIRTMISLEQDDMKNKLAICAIFKNEELYVEEWLEFHYLVGARKFYIYLNNCDDNTYDKIISWQHSHLVEIFDWPMQPGQLQAYQHCLNRHTDDEWIAFIDSDEFLHSRNKNNIIEILDSIPSKYTTVVVNWLIFGSSKLKERSDQPVLETFTRRSEFSFPANKVIKSIVRNNFNAVVRSSHFIETSGQTCYSNGLTCDIGHNGIANEFYCTHLVVNHYFTKSHDEWTKKKMRGRVSISNDDPQKIRAEEQFSYHDRNEVEDLYLYNFLKKKDLPLPENKGHLYIDSIQYHSHCLSLTGWADIHGDEITSVIIISNHDEIHPSEFIRHERLDVLKILGDSTKKFGFTATFPIGKTLVGEVDLIAFIYKHQFKETYFKKSELKLMV